MELFENWAAAKETLLEGLPRAQEGNSCSLFLKTRSNICRKPQHLVLTHLEQRVQRIPEDRYPNDPSYHPRYDRNGTRWCSANDRSSWSGLLDALPVRRSNWLRHPKLVRKLVTSRRRSVQQTKSSRNNSLTKRFYSSSNVGTTGYPPALTATTSVCCWSNS
jgi:hypothetical protein